MFNEATRKWHSLVDSDGLRRLAGFDANARARGESPRTLGRWVGAAIVAGMLSGGVLYHRNDMRLSEIALLRDACVADTLKAKPKFDQGHLDKYCSDQAWAKTNPSSSMTTAAKGLGGLALLLLLAGFGITARRSGLVAMKADALGKSFDQSVMNALTEVSASP